jgi:hypothetical protein
VDRLEVISARERLERRDPRKNSAEESDEADANRLERARVRVALEPRGSRLVREGEVPGRSAAVQPADIVGAMVVPAIAIARN